MSKHTDEQSTNIPRNMISDYNKQQREKTRVEEDGEKDHGKAAKKSKVL